MGEESHDNQEQERKDAIDKGGEEKQSKQESGTQAKGNIPFIFFNWLFNNFSKDIKPFIADHFRARKKDRFYTFVDRLVSLVLLVGILAGLIAVYIWLVSNHSDEADRYIQVILAFLAGGGVATLLRPLSASSMFRRPGKDEE